MIRMQGMIMGIGVALLMAGATAHSGSGKKPGHTKDSLETIRKAVAEGKAVLLDVREKKEWDKGHLQGARLVPLSELKEGKGSLDALLKDLPKGKTLYVHCASGRRVLPASAILKKHGYDARAMKEGFQELSKKGFEKAK